MGQHLVELWIIKKLLSIIYNHIYNHKFYRYLSKSYLLMDIPFFYWPHWNDTFSKFSKRLGGTGSTRRDQLSKLPGGLLLQGGGGLVAGASKVGPDGSGRCPVIQSMFNEKSIANRGQNSSEKSCQIRICSLLTPICEPGNASMKY